MSGVSLHDLRLIAEEKCAGIAEGPPLGELEGALIALGTSASVTALERCPIKAAITAAFDAGASLAQVQEMIALVSALGVHSLMVTALPVLEEAQRRGLVPDGEPLDPQRQALWDRHVGDDPFWDGFSLELPGFLKALLILSPDLFTGFFDYCAIPWKSGQIRASVKELAAMACDAAPTHRFVPGFRVHLANAIKLGVGRAAIMQTIDLAAAAPGHQGYR
jgi:alkylhydroperoxidase/carboxymuconolactone decarboxylase family protein YurZ